MLDFYSFVETASESVFYTNTRKKKGYFLHDLCRNIYKLNTSLKDRRH